MLISGSEAGRRGADPRRHRRGHRVPDPALRHGHAGHRQEDRQRPAGRRVHRGRGRAQPVRDREARLHRRARASFCGSSGVGWMYAMECLAVTPAAAGADGLPWSATARSTIPAPSASSTTTRWSCATWAGCCAGSTPPRRRSTPRCIAYRVAEDRRVFLPLAISARRRLPHPLAGDLRRCRPKAEGRPVPAALRPRRPAAAPRQPDHGGAPGQRGLGHRDPPAERRGDEAGATA